MTVYQYFLLISAVMIVAVMLYGLAHIARLRKRGILPKKGAATLEDVQRLLRDGDKELAERVYHEMTGLDYTIVQHEVAKIASELEKTR